jgi:hypothetical protein
MQVPGQEPKVVLRASWAVKHVEDRCGDWEQVVSLREGEYSLEIWASAEVVAKAEAFSRPYGT